jgi:GntR family transcriptional regulator
VKRVEPREAESPAVRARAAEPAEQPRARVVATAKRDGVRTHLLDLIEQAGPGTALPPERDLALQLGVSRPTVRAAIEDLTRIGLLVRQQGRGTFTSPRKITQELAGRGATAFGVPPAEGDWTSKVLTFRVAPAGAPRATRLKVSPAEPVLRVVRLRLVDDEPMAIERIDLPAHLVPDLTPADMERGNFYRLLRERYEVVVSDAVQSIEPTVTNPDQADLLDVPVYAPVLLIERTTRDADGQIVEFARSIYRGDRYRIISKLSFDSDSG